MFVVVCKIFFCFLSLLTAPAIFSRNLLYLSKKNVLDQTWKSLDTKFGSQWEDWKSSYQVRQNLALFCNLVALILDWNCVKGLIVTDFVKKKANWRGLERVRCKNLFPETIMDKMFEKNLKFICEMVHYKEMLISIFQ